MWRKKHSVFVCILVISFLIISNSSQGFNSNLHRNQEINYSLDWSHYTEIIINNPSNNLTDHQILIEIPQDFNYSYTKLNGDDIRFVDSTNETLDYWIEDWNSTGTSKIWVKCPEINDGNNTFYMFYDNPDANAISNGTYTFDFFDDFENQPLGSFPNEWIISPLDNINLSITDTHRIGDQSLYVDQSPDPTGIGLRNFGIDAVGKILEYWMKPIKSFNSASPYYVDGSISNSTGGNTYWGSRNADQISYYDNLYHYICNFEADNWYHASIHFNSTSFYTQSIYNNSLSLIGQAKNINYRNSPLKIDRLVFTSFAGKLFETYIDNIRIRNYASQELSVYFGETESVQIPTTIIPTNSTTYTFPFDIPLPIISSITGSVLIIITIITNRQRKRK